MIRMLTDINKKTGTEWRLYEVTNTRTKHYEVRGLVCDPVISTTSFQEAYRVFQKALV